MTVSANLRNSPQNFQSCADNCRHPDSLNSLGCCTSCGRISRASSTSPPRCRCPGRPWCSSEASGTQKGTNGVSTSGVTANVMFFDRYFFGYQSVKSDDLVYLFAQSVKHLYFCSDPISVDLISPQPRHSFWHDDPRSPIMQGKYRRRIKTHNNNKETQHKHNSKQISHKASTIIIIMIMIMILLLLLLLLLLLVIMIIMTTIIMMLISIDIISKSTHT